MKKRTKRSKKHIAGMFDRSEAGSSAWNNKVVQGVLVGIILITVYEYYAASERRLAEAQRHLEAL
jgi:hypothetical protein